MSITNVLKRISTTASDVGRRAVDETKTVAQKVEAKATQVAHQVSSFDPRPSATPPPPPQHHSKAPVFRPNQLQASVGDDSSGSTGGTQRTAKKAAAALHEKVIPIPAADLRVLNAAPREVIGKAEVARAVQKAEALPNAERAQFQALINGASNDTEKAYLYKALAAGHSLSEIATFDKSIRGWDAATMKANLTLTDAAHLGTGIKQQYGDTCAPTTAQALRGEYDPIYAYDLRHKNADTSDADLNGVHAGNESLAKEQADLLTGLGRGTTTTRADGSGGTADPAATDAVVNSMSTYTGIRYASDFSGTPDERLDKVAAQLDRGIATPMRLADDKNNGHIVLATEVSGSGPNQKFLIHDPWSGDTTWITRKQFDSGNFDIAGHSKLTSVSVAFPQ